MTQLRLEMDAEFAAILKTLAKGGSEAEVIHKAVSTYKFLKDQTSEENACQGIAITGPEGKITPIALP